MKFEFENIIDFHKNIPAFILCHGPSLDLIKTKLDELKSKSILFGCNEWMNFYDVYPDYWVLANNVINMKSWKNQINACAKQLKLLYSNSVDTTDGDWVSQNIQTSYLAYDQRHFGNGITLQEQVQNYTNYKEHYGSGDTVAVHMLAFAILMGCNPIHIIGLHLDYKQGYASHKGNIPIPSALQEQQYYDRQIRDLTILRESARNIGVEIINLDPYANVNVFKGIENDLHCNTGS